MPLSCDNATHRGGGVAHAPPDPAPYLAICRRLVRFCPGFDPGMFNCGRIGWDGIPPSLRPRPIRFYAAPWRAAYLRASARTYPPSPPSPRAPLTRPGRPPARLAAPGARGGGPLTRTPGCGGTSELLLVSAAYWTGHRVYLTGFAGPTALQPRPARPSWTWPGTTQALRWESVASRSFNQHSTALQRGAPGVSGRPGSVLTRPPLDNRNRSVSKSLAAD